MEVVMKHKSYLLVFASLMVIFMGCTKEELFTEPESDAALKSADSKIRIAVVSDIHYMNHSLLPAVPEENAAYQQLLFTAYNKMVELSEPIFLQAVEEMKREKPDVLLVPGDLAFNGELVNHLVVKEKLQELADLGIRVLVIPGNNDINSPDAMSFEGTGSAPAASISAEEFASVYGNFGYEDALYRDDHSLSYVFEIRDDLWIMGIDCCIYSPVSKRSGEIKMATMQWIQEVMGDAAENGITVFAMMHHGISENYAGQNALIKGDVINNYPWVSASLMEAGLKLIFTGHSHATDIVEVRADGKIIYDIETGSLITPSSPYRIITLSDNFLKVSTKRITHIDASWLGGKSFMNWSEDYLTQHLDLFFDWYLKNVFKLPSDMAEASMPCLRNSMMAQFAGDEKLLPPENRKIEELTELFPGNPVVPIIRSFWIDLPPNDGEMQIKLK